MAAIFPEAQFEALIYIALGMLLGLLIFSAIYIKRLHRIIEQEEGKTELETGNIGLSKKAEDILDKVLENPELQSDLPSKLEVSKATISNGVAELKDRGLIKRKKRANTYLIEPDIDKIEEEQR